LYKKKCQPRFAECGVPVAGSRHELFLPLQIPSHPNICPRWQKNVHVREAGEIGPSLAVVGVRAADVYLHVIAFCPTELSRAAPRSAEVRRHIPQPRGRVCLGATLHRTVGITIWEATVDADASL
jgi:hypothetical protein